MPCLGDVANLASILTAIVAAWAGGYYWYARCTKQKRLEAYLKSEKQINPDGKTHSIVHLMAELGMTEAEILEASFNSKHIVHRTRKDTDTGLAAELLFEYSNDPKQR